MILSPLTELHKLVSVEDKTAVLHVWQIVFLQLLITQLLLRRAVPCSNRQTLQVVRQAFRNRPRQVGHRAFPMLLRKAFGSH